MSNRVPPESAAQVLTNSGFSFVEDGPEPDPATPSQDGNSDDAEFQPRQHPRMHWLTRLLIVIVIFLGGFLVGVLADRSLLG